MCIAPWMKVLVRHGKLSSFKKKIVSWSKMTCLLWKPEIHYSLSKSLPVVSILSQQSSRYLVILLRWIAFSSFSIHVSISYALKLCQMNCCIDFKSLRCGACLLTVRQMKTLTAHLSVWWVIIWYQLQYHELQRVDPDWRQIEISGYRCAACSHAKRRGVTNDNYKTKRGPYTNPF